MHFSKARTYFILPKTKHISLGRREAETLNKKDNKDDEKTNLI